MTPQGRRILAAALAGAIVGALAGAWCQRIAYHNYWKTGPNPQRFLRRLTSELVLDAKQGEAVGAVLEAQRSKIVALHQETSSKLEEVRKQMRSDIEKLLNPEQRVKFEAMTARWDKRRQQKQDFRP